MEARILASRIAAIIERTRVGISTEESAHLAVLDALRAAGMDVQAEVWITDSDRVDLLVEGVGIEVKVKGGRRDIYRQLQRYARSDRIEALVLATGLAWPSSIKDVDGTPLIAASLTRGWL